MHRGICRSQSRYERVGMFWVAGRACDPAKSPAQLMSHLDEGSSRGR
jgi:hypothetical protein